MKQVKEPPKIPKDLGLKIGTKEEAYLQKLKEMLEDERRNCEITAKLNKEFLVIVEKHLLEEKNKFK